MKRALLAVAALVTACVGDGEIGEVADVAEVGAVDATSDRADAGTQDAGTQDSGRIDAGTADSAGSDVGTADAGPTDVGTPPETDFTAIPWSEPGYGVAYRDSENPRGQDVFIGYAGYAVQAPWARAWVTQLFRDALHDRGVRHVYAVQGPRDSAYAAQEIGNSRLIAHLLPRLAPGARILVAAHSSGAFVASELLQQLYRRGLDPTHITVGRLSYWDLDGASDGLTAAIVGQMQHAWFVWANAGATRSPNAGTMIAAGNTYASAGGALQLDASASGCNAGAVWCLHMAPITTRSHNPSNASAQLDYSGFDAAHRVQTAWLTRTNFGAP